MIVGAGAVLFATSFVPLWATYRVPGLGVVAPRTVHQNAWGAYGRTMELGLVLVLTVTVIAAVFWVRSAIRSPRVAGVLLALCGIVTLLLLWQVVTGPLGSSNPNGYGIDRGVLLFTGVALAGAMTYGSYLTRKETAWESPFGDDVRRARR